MIPTSISDLFRMRPLDDVLKTTTQAELAGSASDSVREDCFKQHVARVHTDCLWSSNSLAYSNAKAVDEYFESLWKLEEARILETYFRNKSRKNLTTAERKQFNNKSNPFRSMKSVIRACAVAAVPLVDNTGMPLGKSALQIELKVERDPATKFETAIKAAAALVYKLPDTDTATLTRLRNMVLALDAEMEQRVKDSKPF